MTISYRIQSDPATRLSATFFNIICKARDLGIGALGCFVKPHFDVTRLSPHLRQDAGIDEQSLIQEATRKSMLIR